jgi:glycosyltransferase involved in cell wall biosynthesis
VIAAYREAEHIGAVVREVLGYGPKVLVVDDGSDDDTAALAEAAGAEVLRHPENRGKGAATQSGLNWARSHGYETAITLDGDGQHAPSDLPAFFQAYAEAGTAVLLGDRMANAESMPLVRRCTNAFMSWLLSRAAGVRIPDTQCGYRMFRCDVLPEVWPDSARFAAESEMLLDLAEQGVEMGAVPVATIYGEEKSKIRPLPDTWRFFSMLRRRKKIRRARERAA